MTHEVGSRVDEKLSYICIKKALPTLYCFSNTRESCHTRAHGWTHAKKKERERTVLFFSLSLSFFFFFGMFRLETAWFTCSLPIAQSPHSMYINMLVSPLPRLTGCL